MPDEYHGMAFKLDNEKQNISYIGTPDLCPLCNVKILPQILSFAIHNNRLEGLFRCTNNKCGSVFIGKYIKRDKSVVFDFSSSYPRNALEVDFGESIESVSTSFIEIYNQANAAESHNLNEVAGIGYRKALEYLIKDFAIHKNPEKEDDIKKSFLGNCINDYLDDANVKACAKRATWLGNDEAHYVRKWEGKDVEDLKVLIKLTVNWIENVLLTEKYTADMES